MCTSLFQFLDQIQIISIQDSCLHVVMIPINPESPLVFMSLEHPQPAFAYYVKSVKVGGSQTALDSAYIICH